jgi:WD40 repeat protein/tetratricopeptide (TPR) repeat protein/predicted Ser/Thr protein kinase
MQDDSLPVSVQLHLEEVCARFEASWKAAGSAETGPRIEEYLGGAGERGRTALLRELLRLDVHYRRQHGQDPGIEDCVGRCPADVQTIRDLFTELFGLSPAPREAEPAGERDRATMRPGPAAETAADPNVTGPLERLMLLEEPTTYPSLPGYEILGELGRGAMGVVYQGRQTGLKRLVALKMILSGDQASPQELERFRAEAEAVARLQHPNIVQVYEVGEYAGRPFFSLEYVAGGTLATKLRTSLPDPKAAADLVEKLARALDAVHRCDVVHRDLKPANVLLTADGTPKVTDFGLAKKLDEDAGQTHPNAIMGTPSYMAPEQASGGAARVTPAADVYALGAILYECLTGRPPFRAASVAQTLRQVVEEEPVRPRQLNPAVPRDLETICLKCLSKEPTKRYASAEALADDLQRWLRGEAILARPMGWLEKLGRWCCRHPAPATAAAVILLTVATAFALVMQSRDEAVVAKDAAVKLAEEKDDLANKNGTLAEERGKLARDNEEKAKANALLATQERELRQKLQRQAANTFLTDGLYSLERGDVSRGMLLLAHGLELAHETKAADLEQACRTQLALWSSRAPAVKMLLPHTDEVLGVAFSPDGKRILTGCADKTARLWDASIGQPLGEPLRPSHPDPFRTPKEERRSGAQSDPQPKHRGEVTAVAFSPDGRTLALGIGDPLYRGRAQLRDALDEIREVQSPLFRLPRMGGGRDRVGPSKPPSRLSLDRLMPSYVLWDAAAGTPLEYGPASQAVWAVAFSPDGRSVVIAEGTLQKGATSEHPDGARMPWPNLRPFPRPDDVSEIIGRRSGVACVWDTARDTAKAARHLLPHQNAVLTVAFSPDGRRILTGSADQTTRLWDAGTGKQIGKPLVHDGYVLAVAFSPDGRTILTCSQKRGKQGTVQLWNADTRKPLGSPLPHRFLVLAAAFSPDGRVVVTGSGDPDAGKGEVQLWSVATGKPLGPALPHPGPVHSVAWSPDGRGLVTGCADKVARVWEALPAPAVVRVGHHENVIAYTPDGRRGLLGAASQKGLGCEQVSLIETNRDKVLAQLTLGAGNPGLVAFSPDGRRAALHMRVGSESDLYLLDAVGGRLLGQVGKLADAVEALAVSPDGQTILAGISRSHKRPGEARLWNARTGRSLGAFPHEAPVLSVAFSPDGQTAATGSGMPGTQNGATRLWDVRTGRPLETLAHQGPVRVVHFSPDGHTLASASDDRTVRLQDVGSGKPRGAALAHQAPVRALAFSPDGRRLLTGSDDRTAQLWDATTGTPIGDPLQHQGPVRAVAISGDGLLLATGSDDQTVRLWDAATGRSVEDPLPHPGPVIGVAFSSDGRTLLTRSANLNSWSWRMVGLAQETAVGSGWDAFGRVWALPAPVEGEPTSVLLRTEIATGQELDAGRRGRVLEAPAWRERRTRLGERAELAPSDSALGEWHRREARAAEAAGEWFSALWHLERLGKGEPDSEQLHGRRGIAYALCNRWEQALAELTKELRPKGDPRSDLWYFRGLAYTALNQHDKALDDFTAAISAEGYRRSRNVPGMRDAWVLFFRRGETRFRLGQMDKVIEDLSQALKMNPDHGPSRYGRGLAHAALGDLERAATDFADALRRPGVPATAWCDLAKARLYLNDVTRYREACARGLQDFGNTEDAVLAASLAWTCSLVPGGSSDPEQAVRLAQVAITRNAESYVSQRTLGATLYRAGRFPEAIDHLTRAIPLRKRPSPSTWFFLAMAHHRANHPEEARKWLDKAREWIEQSRRRKPGAGGDDKPLSWEKLPWNERVVLTVLQREAETLIQGNPAKP